LNRSLSSRSIAETATHRRETEVHVSDSGVETVSCLLTELARAGIKLSLVGDDQIRVIAPKGALSADLRDRISIHKQGLVVWLGRVRKDGAGDAGLPTLVPDAENLFEPFLPSDLQQSFLIGSREGFEYYVRPHQYMEFEFDELDPARFETAFNQAIARQRKNIVVVRPDMLLETVRDLVPVRLTVSDLRGLPDTEAQASMARVRATMQREEPPHDRWPWLVPHISLYGTGRARLHYNSNNLFADAPSGVGLINAAMHYYDQPDVALPELQVSYRDCVLALEDLERSQLGQESKKYWCDRMADWPSAPDLPLTGGAEHRGRSRLSRRELLMPAPLWAALKHKAEARGLSLTNTLLGIHAEVIAYWSGSRHFLLNNMITHRQLPLHPQMAEVLGNFASLYPLEVDWRHDEPFHARVQRLQAQLMADIAHTSWPGSKVLQTLNQIRRTPGRAICPFAVGSALFVNAGEPPFYSMLETPQTLLDTEFWQMRDGRLWVIWDVIEAMFPPGLIGAMLDGYQSIFTRLAEDDGAWQVRAFDLLPAGQQEQRAALNNSEPTVPGALLHSALPRQARDLPDKLAVVGPSDTLTYAELHRRSGRVAEVLRGCGTQRGDRIAIVLPKGCAQPVAVLGTLVAGAAYVPIDPAWPAERVRYLLADTGTRAVVTNDALAGELAVRTELPVLAVDSTAAQVSVVARGAVAGVPEPARDGPSRPTPDDLAPDLAPDDLAYVIYTSGSTGRPKGAMLNHCGPLNTIIDINNRFGVCADDVVFGVSSLCFDLSVYDIFGTVAAGATLVLPAAAQADPGSWIDTVHSRGVTVWNSVPAVMQLFVEEAISAGVQLPALRIVALSGDWIPLHLPARIREVAPNATVISLGGATEASIWSICFPIEEVDPAWPSIPYGKPLAGQTWHVLDEQGRDAPTWTAGHLYIGGSGVALGYLNDPAKTQAAFVAHPRTGERLYRTGDLGRFLPSGDIEFLGRADHQVKIQGFRVEPGEVEHALLEHPDVEQAAVVARASGSGRQLAAFIVGVPDRPAPDLAGLRAFLAERLPSYLYPSHITVLDRMPLTANGKLDRAALMGAGQVDPDAVPTFVAARTATEEALVSIWESTLSTRPIGVHDDFFDLGGQSFAALRMIGQIARQLGRRVPLGALLESRTVAGLAEWLGRPDADWSPVVQLSREAGGDPWFFVHPAGGDVLCYRTLAGLLDGPCYALQAPGPASGRPASGRVEELAALYVQALCEIRPHGPYRLGGWSSGAVIAAEMAAQLDRQGEITDRLVVLDAPAPLAPREVDDWQLLLWFLEDLDVGFDPDLARAPAPAARDLATMPDAQRLTLALAMLREQGIDDIGLSTTDLAATLAVFQGVVRACCAYAAPKIPADITVVRAGRGVVGEFADHPFATAPDWGWTSVTSGRVDATTVQATHHTLLSDRLAVEAVAKAISWL
jgi:amino acid adenylation domain-containing protein